MPAIRRLTLGAFLAWMLFLSTACAERPNLSYQLLNTADGPIVWFPPEWGKVVSVGGQNANYVTFVDRFGTTRVVRVEVPGRPFRLVPLQRPSDILNRKGVHPGGSLASR